MNTKKYFFLTIVLSVVLGFGLVGFVSAQTNPAPGFSRGGGRGAVRPGVFGTVAAVSGNTITVQSRGFGQNSTQTTYTVDATNAKVTKNNAASSVSGIAVGDTIMVQGTISGTNVTATSIRDGVGVGANGFGNGNGISGKVASINGNTLTVTGKTGFNRTATTATYTVDASNATVTKNGTSSSVSNIAVGDTIMVQGTVSGTSVTAKTIRDGVPQSAIQGNGQPVVAGSVTSNNGTDTIQITNKSNVSYTITTSSSTKFVVTGVTNPTISDIKDGDNLVVQGTVNGTSITASSVIDQKAKTNNNTSNSGNNQKPKSDFMGGVMSGITIFFKHLFGF